MGVGFIVFASFWSLAIWTLARRDRRAVTLARTRGEWFVDLTNLIVQGAVVPLAQAALAFGVCRALIPGLEGSVGLPFWAAFLLNFVAVDYAYYWNHRLLHVPGLWKLHRPHHEGGVVDVFTTSRNLLWSPVFIVYLWLNGIFVFLLGNPEPFLLAAALTAALDLWRHSSLAPRSGSRLHRALARVLITPLEHHAHHDASTSGINFGANLSAWDRIHGTYRPGLMWPKAYGTADRTRSVWRRLIFP